MRRHARSGKITQNERLITESGNNKINKSNNVKSHRNNKINQSNKVERKTKHKFGDPVALPFLEEEVYQVGHVLIILGFVPTSRGPHGPSLHLKLGLVPRPSHRGLELLGSGPRERIGVLTLLVQVVTIERLV